MKIELTQNQKTIIDQDDYELVSKHKWSANKLMGSFYAMGKVGGKSISLHRFLLNPKEKLEVDHINGNTLDNRRSNLRVCTHQQNMLNRKMHKNNTSGFSGIYFEKDRNKWTVQIRFMGKKVFMGRFINLTDAVDKRDEVVSKYHGEYSRGLGIK